MLVSDRKKALIHGLSTRPIETPRRCATRSRHALAGGPPALARTQGAAFPLPACPPCSFSFSSVAPPRMEGLCCRGARGLPGLWHHCLGPTVRTYLQYFPAVFAGDPLAGDCLWMGAGVPGLSPGFSGL